MLNTPLAVRGCRNGSVRITKCKQYGTRILILAKNGTLSSPLRSKHAIHRRRAVRSGVVQREDHPELSPAEQIATRGTEPLVFLKLPSQGRNPLRSQVDFKSQPDDPRTIRGQGAELSQTVRDDRVASNLRMLADLPIRPKELEPEPRCSGCRRGKASPGAHDRKVVRQSSPRRSTYRVTNAFQASARRWSE